MSNSVGIIAEDESDVDVVKELIKKIVPDKRFSVHFFVGHGCGKIRGKSFQWAINLKKKGCSTLIVLQDLDNNKINNLRSQLCKTLKNCAIKNHIVVIPIREIEAWLLSDSHAIRLAMNLPMEIESIEDPQLVEDPKKKLGELIYHRSGNKKHYVNSVHNQKIAQYVDIVEIRKCESFLPLEGFVHEFIK